MEITRAKSRNINELIDLFSEARETISRLGIDQWQNGYPSKEIIEEDIELNRLYVVMSDNKLCGTFVMINDGEPTYDHIFNGNWLTGNDSTSYIAIHRVAIAVAARGQGISTKIINYAIEYAKSLSRDSLRIDTHEGNIVMRRMLEKHGFKYCGIIYLENGDARVAYEKTID